MTATATPAPTQDFAPQDLAPPAYARLPSPEQLLQLQQE